MKELVVSKFKRKYEDSGKLTVAIMQLLDRELETLINKDQFNEQNLVKVDHKLSILTGYKPNQSNGSVMYSQAGGHHSNASLTMPNSATNKQLALSQAKKS